MDTLFFTPLLVSLAAIIYCMMSFYIISLRRKNKVALGNGNNKKLEYAISAQRNLLEYTLVFLFLLLFAEILGLHLILLLFSVVIFCIGRGVHMYAFLSQKDGKLRVIGMAFTFSAILIMAMGNLYSLLF